MKFGSWRLSGLVAVVASAWLLTGSAGPALAMCGGNPFVNCPPPKKAADAPVGRKKERKRKALPVR